MAGMSLKYLLLVGCLVGFLQSGHVETASTSSSTQSSEENLPSTTVPTNTSQEDAGGVAFEAGDLSLMTSQRKSMFATPTVARATASTNAITGNASEILAVPGDALALLPSNVTLNSFKEITNLGSVPARSSPISSTTTSLTSSYLSLNSSETLDFRSSTATITSTESNDMASDVPFNEVAVNATSINSTHHLIPSYTESEELKPEASVKSHSSTKSIIPSNTSSLSGVTLPPSLGYSQENRESLPNGIFKAKLLLPQDSTHRSNQDDTLTVPQNVLSNGNVYVNFDEIIHNYTYSTALPDNIVPLAIDKNPLPMVDDTLMNSTGATNSTKEERLKDNIVLLAIDTEHILMVDDTLMNSTGATNSTEEERLKDNSVPLAIDTKHILMVDDSLMNSTGATNSTEEERLKDSIVPLTIDTKHIPMVDDSLMNSTEVTNSTEEKQLKDNIDSSRTLDEFLAIIENGNSSKKIIIGKQKHAATFNYSSGFVNNHTIASTYVDFDGLTIIRNDTLAHENAVETMANFQGEKNSTVSEDFYDFINLSDDQDHFPNNSFIKPNQSYNSTKLEDHPRNDIDHKNLTAIGANLLSDESSSPRNQSLHTPDNLVVISGENGSDFISNYFQDTHVDLIASDSVGTHVYYPLSPRNRRKTERYYRPKESLYQALAERTLYVEDLVYHPHQEKLPDVKNPLAGYKLKRNSRNEPIVVPPQHLQHTYLPPNQNRRDTGTSSDTSIPSSTSVLHPHYPSEPRLAHHRATADRKNSYREEVNSYATDSSYDFSYFVNDPYGGNQFSHSERKAGPSTTGEYQVLLPDGRIQTVVYTADHEGYNAKVTYTDADQNVKLVSGGGSSAKYSKYETVTYSPPLSDYVTPQPISTYTTAGYNSVRPPLISDGHPKILSQNGITNLHKAGLYVQQDSDDKISRIGFSSFSDGANLDPDTFHGNVGGRDYNHFNKINQVREGNDNHFNQINQVREGNDNRVNQRNQVREGNDNHVNQRNQVREGNDNHFDQRNLVREGNDNHFDQRNQVREGNDNNFNQRNQVREGNDNHVNQRNQVREGNDNHVNQRNQVREGHDNHFDQRNQVREGNDNHFDQRNQVREGNDNHVNQRNQIHQNAFHVNLNNQDQSAVPQVNLNPKHHSILSGSRKQRLNPMKASRSRDSHEQSSPLKDSTYNDARSKINAGMPHKRLRNYHVSDISKEKYRNLTEVQINRIPKQRKQDKNESSESIFDPPVSTVGPRIFHPSLLALKGTGIWAAYFRDDRQSSTNTPPITRDRLIKTLNTKSATISRTTSQNNHEGSVNHAAYFIPTETGLTDGRNLVKRHPQILERAANKFQTEGHFDRFPESFDQDEIGSTFVDASQNTEDDAPINSFAMPHNFQTVPSTSPGRGIFADVKLASDHLDKVQAFDSLLDSNLAIFARTTTNPLQSTNLATPVQSTTSHAKQTLKPKKGENSPSSTRRELTISKSKQESTDGEFSTTREQLIGHDEGSDQWLSGPSTNNFVELLKLSESNLEPVIVDAVPDSVRNFKRETSETESFHRRFQNDTDASSSPSQINSEVLNSPIANSTDYRMNTMTENDMNNVVVLPEDSSTIVARNDGEANMSDVLTSENLTETSLTRPNEILSTSDYESVGSLVVISDDNKGLNLDETTKFFSKEDNDYLTDNSEPRMSTTQRAIHNDVHGVHIGNEILEEVEESVPLTDLSTDNNQTMLTTIILNEELEHNTTLLENLIKDSIGNATESIDKPEAYDTDRNSNKTTAKNFQSSVGMGDSSVTSEGELSTTDIEFLSQLILFLDKDIKPMYSVPYTETNYHNRSHNFDGTTAKNNSINDVGFV